MMIGPPAVAEGAERQVLPEAAVPESRSLTRELQGALDEVVAAGATGVILRMDDGRRAYRLASGKSQLDPARKLLPDAKVRVGSITKSFVSTVVLQLVGEGRLSLDDTVEHWKPGLIPGGDQITVRQLLNHTSGIFNYTEDPSFFEQVVADRLAPWTPQQLIDLANAHPPCSPPGPAGATPTPITSWSA